MCQPLTHMKWTICCTIIVHFGSGLLFCLFYASVWQFMTAISALCGYMTWHVRRTFILYRKIDILVIAAVAAAAAAIAILWKLDKKIVYQVKQTSQKLKMKFMGYDIGYTTRIPIECRSVVIGFCSLWKGLYLPKSFSLKIYISICAAVKSKHCV